MVGTFLEHRRRHQFLCFVVVVDLCLFIGTHMFAHNYVCLARAVVGALFFGSTYEHTVEAFFVPICCCCVLFFAIGIVCLL